MPAMHGGVAFRIKQIIHVAPGDSAKGRGRIGGSKDCSAGLGNTLIQRISQNSHAVNIAQLTLICTKTQSGVTLHMLNGFKAFTDRQFDGTGTDIQLKINKLARRSASTFGVRHQK